VLVIPAARTPIRLILGLFPVVVYPRWSDGVGTGEVRVPKAGRAAGWESGSECASSQGRSLGPAGIDVLSAGTAPGGPQVSPGHRPNAAR
jgi:hypothetical protein